MSHSPHNDDNTVKYNIDMQQARENYNKLSQKYNIVQKMNLFFAVFGVFFFIMLIVVGCMNSPRVCIYITLLGACACAAAHVVIWCCPSQTMEYRFYELSQNRNILSVEVIPETDDKKKCIVIINAEAKNGDVSRHRIGCATVIYNTHCESKCLDIHQEVLYIPYCNKPSN